jgi:ubiquinone/menaquinone biosynthesis C-methylase UbiE
MKRFPSKELLDDDSGTPEEVQSSLADLRRINRWFGGVGTSLRMIQHIAQVTQQSELSLLEVAAGSGFVPDAVRQQLKQTGLCLRVTLLDRVRSHVNGNDRAVVADALALPFKPLSFDLVSCNLFAHHLTPQQLVEFVNEALRCCRLAVLVNDLVRSPWHLALVYAGFPLYRSRITRNDAPASVRQAYTVDEMREMLKLTGASRTEITRHYLYRMGAVIWRS